MRFLLMILSITAFGLLGTAYAQPLEDVAVTVLEFENSTVSVQFAWNHDDAVSSYDVGCVSCFPNLVENTIHDEIVLRNITSMENGLTLLYIIAYDDDGEIITAKQIMLDLD